ncbi:uncharacterized protein LOC112348939 [Selaginella moellendorffii]|uniref:uncharacterized protein LOC112348939 n=1 Tax=Selaginella moellendorffii TaxID=88036 RepID=UPI000D1C240C|nr:uncharacterized protein LOC112348939 [Selaginella moellendorffii]|eukprot:XP_024538129.1 uncharacterized protein LOC112348939 [Selaginella moellendorffii]
MEAGTIVQLPELLEPGSPFCRHMKSLRVMGTLESFDVESGVAHIRHEGASLAVDTTLLRDIHLRPGSLYQFIGELLLQSGMMLRARVARNVDGLDVKLYEKALRLRRIFQEQRATSSPR